MKFSLRIFPLLLIFLSSAALAFSQGSAYHSLDFNTDAEGMDLPAGTVITDQYAAWGVQISTDNDARKHPDKAIIFNSSSPTGGDADLGTPNENYGGPGQGEGGTGAGANKIALGNLLIVAENDIDEDGDMLIDTPDDEASGGTIRFQFDNAVSINGLTLVDIDKNEKGAIFRITDADGKVREYPIAGLGDNSVVEVQQGWQNVISLEVMFPGSGAIAELRFL